MSTFSEMYEEISVKTDRTAEEVMLVSPSMWTWLQQQAIGNAKARRRWRRRDLHNTQRDA